MSHSKCMIITQMILGMIALFAMTMITGCEHKSKVECQRFTKEYIYLVTIEQIANQAAQEMMLQCGGPYNIESMNQNDKRIQYVFTCPNSCK